MSVPNIEEKRAYPSSNNDATTKEQLNYVDTKDAESSLGAPPDFNETARILDHKAERALCRKFDFRILPVLAIMCTSHNRSRMISRTKSS